MERSRYLYRSSSRYQKTWQEKLKDFLRNFVAFMFTNVGIIGLVIGYTVAGAFMFIAIEGTQSHELHEVVKRERNDTAIYLWELTYEENLGLYTREAWQTQVATVIHKYQEKFVDQARKGYDPNPGSWSFSGAFLYSLTVITTIGYGNLAPRTLWGKVATVLYAIAGMPLFLLYLSNIGDILAKSFKWTYFKICLCKGCPGSSSFRRNRIQQDIQMTRVQTHQDEFLPHREWQISHAEESSRRSRKSSPESGETESEDSDDEESEEDAETNGSEQYDPQAVTVPITLCLAIMVGYVSGGAILFDIWEDWGPLDGSYFCFISLSTIGFGDIVPGDEIYRSDNTYLNISFIATSIYLMLGMALIAMCFNLMQEEVIHKARTCIKMCKNIFTCCRRDPVNV